MRKKAKKAEKIGIKLPFFNWFLVKGTVLKEWENSRKIRSKMYRNLFEQYARISERLKRYED